MRNPFVRPSYLSRLVLAATFLAIPCCSSPAWTGPERMTHSERSSRAPAWSPDGSAIAFESQKAAGSNLFLLELENGAIRRLTDGNSNNRAPSWSPDGTKLVFVSDRTGSPELHILNFVTRVPRLLAALPGAESSPSWSPDGEWIAFTREVEGEFDILRIHPDGGRLQDLLVGEGRDVWPRWSPDGERLLFFSRRDTGGVDDEVHELTVQTGRIRRITRRAGHDFCPIWSPRGQTLAVVAIQTDGSRWISLLDSGGVETGAIGRNFYRVTEPSWAPEGERIAFAGRITENEPYQIYVEHTSDSEITCQLRTGLANRGQGERRKSIPGIFDDSRHRERPQHFVG